MQSSPPKMTFRRSLYGQRLEISTALLGRLDLVQLSQGPDEFRWNLKGNCIFFVDSMYRALLHSDLPVDNNKKNWKMKIPLKIKIFTWYLRKGVILTKDNLVTRNWHGSTKCVFCLYDETIKHLFFQCKVASNLYPP